MENTRRLRKRDTTHKTLMHSAKLLFEENGISGVTIEQITEKADVSRSTFFSHFASVDDLLNQIANEEVNDIISAACDNGRADISAIFARLNKDTYPYPYLMCELLTKNILSGENSSIEKVFSMMQDEIAGGEYDSLLGTFSKEDISAFIFGAYFGLVFQKFIGKEPFDDPAKTGDVIEKYIDFLKKA